MNTFLKIIGDVILALMATFVIYIIANCAIKTVQENKPQEILAYEECLVNQKINPDDYICVKPKSLMTGEIKW